MKLQRRTSIRICTPMNIVIGGTCQQNLGSRVHAACCASTPWRPSELFKGRYQTLPIRRREEEFGLVVERHTSPHISHRRVVENLGHLCSADRGLGYGHGKELLWADGECDPCDPSEVALLTWIRSECASKKRDQQLLSATPATCLALKWRVVLAQNERARELGEALLGECRAEGKRW